MVQTPCQSLKVLLVNEHWGLMEEYLAGEKFRLVTRLCNCNETELKDLQGQVKMIDKILALKKQLITEQGSKR